MNILVFNYHVPYIYNLAKTGHKFFVVNPEGRIWDYRMRPKPANVEVIDGAGAWLQFVPQIDKLIDVVLMQDNFVGTPQGLLPYDMLATQGINKPKIMLFHNSFNTMFKSLPVEQKENVRNGINKVLNGVRKVFISEFKKNSYGYDGDVVLPGIDLEDFGGWRCKDGLRTLTCCNNAIARDFMNGTKQTYMLNAGLHFVLLGEEGGKGQIAQSFEHLRDVYRETAFYICLNNAEFEDGYNLSGLEAMATGVPMVTLNHPSSPVIDGYNGFKHEDIEELNKRIVTCDNVKLIKMSENARETVRMKFNINDFVEKWNEIFYLAKKG
jgi:hypothetical protein